MEINMNDKLNDNSTLENSNLFVNKIDDLLLNQGAEAVKFLFIIKEIISLKIPR
jgi:hypothetical protein